ncbi:class I adenylate-forming enzyme family protein [Rhodococcus koreensis]|uniref:Long-chain acyl-CoA synthetase n=1 Tax=Rhodococcus koreensis TaxID=99653 RepID=A0A1H4X8U8_9NOCA|nr:class I adenylate-forming enzyme family protein [Rhodococcus koreensis]SED02086.1 long-chain acyl-CoA synthetase [Rhodococcus koreensis]
MPLPGRSEMELPQQLDFPKIAFDAVLAHAARAYPERIALRDGQLTLTFSELHDHALRVAAGLRAQGVRRGDLIALHLPNTLWFPVAYFAILGAGATACPVNPAQPAEVVRRQLEHFGAVGVITHPSCAANVISDLPPQIRLCITVPATAAAPAPDSGGPAETTTPWHELLAADPLDDGPVDPDSVAHLQLTGGTTGQSKGVRVLHRNLVSNILQAARRRSSVEPDLDDNGLFSLRPIEGARHQHTEELGRGVVAQVSPYFHGMGLINQCTNTMLGISVVVEGRFDPDRYLADIETYGVTKLSGSTAFYHALLASEEVTLRNLSSVISISCGGAPVDTSTLARLRTVFTNAEVMQVYGLSEATCTVVMQPPVTLADSPAGSAGLPVVGTEVELRDDSGVPIAAVGGTGEIWVRGPQVTDGYHQDPELTAQQFRDGWLRTGDLGRFDEQGHLFIIGRVKDMIIYKGYNVYPAHLEEILGTHPAVARSAVVGIARADVDEIPVAFVVPHPSEQPGPVLADDLMHHVGDRVAPYQRLREVHFVEDLPLSPTGKVLKSALREFLST